MKKFLALTALVLGLASCQTEPEGLDINVGGVVDTVVTVNIPESETRANAGTNSAEGAFANGVLGTESDNTTMRYIFQVYYNGETSDDKHHRQVAYSDGTSVSFPVRLIPGRDYRFVVWADVVADGKNDTDLHYNTDNLTNITLNGDWNAMDETRDAFTAYKDVVKYNGQQAINIDLYRPFAKLRVLTTDFDVLESYGVSAKYATVEYTTEHRVGFNAYTGAAAAASETKTHSYEIANYSTETNASRTIFSDYFFAENDVVSFNLYVYEDEAKTKLIKQIAFNTDINVKRNYLTTLKGNVLTEGNKVNVEVKPGLGGIDDPDYNYNVLTSGDELVTAIANGGSYKVGNNIYVADTRAAIATRAAAGQNTTILNLNGYKITFEDGATITVPAGKTLIINDESKDNGEQGGVVIEKDENNVTGEGGFIVEEGATLTIEGGNIGENTIENNGTTNINGGNAEAGAIENNGTTNVNNEDSVEDDSIVNGENGLVFDEGRKYDETTNTYLISNTLGLNWIAEQVNSGAATFAGFALANDIDLAGYEWICIGTQAHPFNGTFDGNGKSIKNLNIVETEAKEGKAYIGFFGYANNATIKNVTFENVNLNIPCLDIDHSQGHIGAVAGSLEGTSTIENVTVKGDIKVYATQEANGASRVAVVAGGNSYGNVTMENVHVIANEGSYLIANNNAGALAGQLQGKSVCKNCSSNIDVTVNKFFAGGLIGLAAGDQLFENCHTTGDIAVVAGREGRAHDQYRVGGIAGGWADGKKNVCTLTNCSYTGNVSGKNSDGSVAYPLDYAGYVGRGYTLAGCQGSTVVIDGIKYIQKYNDTENAGIYDVVDAEGKIVFIHDAEGNCIVDTADKLVAALEANENVIFTRVIKIDPAGMSNAYGTTGINVKNGQTIDGNGHTLDIKGAGGTWDSGINTTGGLIKNITVTGSFRGIFINHNSTHAEKVVLENVTIEGTTYTISCDQGKNQNFEAYNSTFKGWTSYAATIGNAKFTGCYFGYGNGYSFCRPYAPTEFVGCQFEEGYRIDPRAAVTFENCTLNGVTLTAENIADLVSDTAKVTIK